MGIPILVKIDDACLGFQCQQCLSHLARADGAIKGEFRGQLGPAVFIDTVLNIRYERQKQQKMSSGEYLVRYVRCKVCNTYLGWTYDHSYNSEYGYKVGKFCLEVRKLRQRSNKRPRRISLD